MTRTMKSLFRKVTAVVLSVAVVASLCLSGVGPLDATNPSPVTVASASSHHQEEWNTSTTGQPYSVAYSKSRETVYTHDYSSTLTAINATSGAKRWSTSTGGNTAYAVGYNTVTGYLYSLVSAGDGEWLLKINASDGSVLKNVTAGNGVEIPDASQISIDSETGDVYIAMRNGVKRFDGGDLTEKWAYNNEQYVSVTYVESKDTAYYTTNDGHLGAVDKNGDHQWRNSYASSLGMDVEYFKGDFYTVYWDGNGGADLMKIDGGDRSKAWTVSYSENAETLGVLAENDTLLTHVGGLNTLYEYDLAGNKLKSWSYSGHIIDFRVTNEGTERYYAADESNSRVLKYDTGVSVASNVSGTVTDTSGDTLTDASVTVTNASNGSVVYDTTTDPTGSWNTSLTDGDYTVSVSKDGYESKSKTTTLSGSSKTIDFALNYSLSGRVVNEHGQPVPNATVKLLAVNFTALNTTDPTELNETANQYLRDAQNVTPPDWNPDANVRANVSGLNGKYVAVHTRDDWRLRGYDIDQIESAPTLGADPQLSAFRTRFDTDTELVFTVVDATETSLLEDNVDEDMPGKTASGTVVVQRVGPGGEAIDDPVRLNTSGTVRIRSAANPGGKVHETASTDLPSGFYRVYPESNPGAARVVAVGNPERIITGWREDLKTKAGDLTEQAKQIQSRINNHEFGTITTTTNSTGHWSVTPSAHLEKADVIAYRVPDGLNVDPRNATLADVRAFYESGDYNGSYVLPARSTRTGVPNANVTVRVREVDAPGYADVERYANLSDWFDSFLANNSYSDAIPLLQQRLENATDEQVRELYREWLQLAKQNEELREKANENADGKTVIRKTEKVVEQVEGANTEEMREDLQTLRQTVSELRSTIDNGSVERTVREDTVSLRFPFDSNLKPEQVTVLVHYSNGTSVPLSPANSTYVSINSQLGDDEVVVSDYPLGENATALADFEVVVATPDGVGKASESVRNPTFNGTVPDLEGIDLSTLRPGPSETVELTVHPAAASDYRNLSSLVVYGPDGNTMASNVTGGRTGEFTTSGTGTYHVEVTYANVGGDEFTTVFQVTADETDRDMPAGLRVVESETGMYALTGDKLDGGRVELGGSASTVRVFARIENASDVPREVHVYTLDATVPSSATLDVHVVRGESETAVSEVVDVTLHLATLPEDAYVYRNGAPVPQTGQARYGRVEEQDGHTVIMTYTDESGELSVATNANPGLRAWLTWRYKTTVPELAAVIDTSWPTGTPSLLGIVAVGLYHRRRRRTL